MSNPGGSAQHADRSAQHADLGEANSLAETSSPQTLPKTATSPYWRPPGPSVATRKPSRRSRFSSRSSIVGGAEPRRIYCEGGLEEKAAYTFLAHPDVADVREQPAPVYYTDENGIRTKHTFDFLVILKSGTKIAVQIKPVAFEVKWRPIIKRIAKQMSPKFADKAHLITERNLHPDLVENSILIHAVRRDPPGEHDASMRRIVDTLHGEVSIRELVAYSGLDGAGFRAIVRLIADGALLTDGSRIEYRTKVRRPVRTAEGERP